RTQGVDTGRNLVGISVSPLAGCDRGIQQLQLWDQIAELVAEGLASSLLGSQYRKAEVGRPKSAQIVQVDLLIEQKLDSLHPFINASGVVIEALAGLAEGITKSHQLSSRKASDHRLGREQSLVKNYQPPFGPDPFTNLADEQGVEFEVLLGENDQTS